MQETTQTTKPWEIQEGNRILGVGKRRNLLGTPQVKVRLRRFDHLVGIGDAVAVLTPGLLPEHNYLLGYRSSRS